MSRADRKNNDDNSMHKTSNIFKSTKYVSRLCMSFSVANARITMWISPYKYAIELRDKIAHTDS